MNLFIFFIIPFQPAVIAHPGGLFLNKDILWEKACVLIRDELNEVTYNTWIVSGLKALSFENDCFVLEAITPFYCNIIRQRYINLINTCLTQAAQRPVSVSVLTPAEAEEHKTVKEQKSAPVNESKTILNPKYTFDTFVVGNNNRFAHAASLAVAEAPADAYNPLFIYGGVGLGKTHLMHAIGHFVLAQNPETRISYLTSEEFTNEVISSIQDRKASSNFREKYRNIDILMIDDIQFIAGKERTQEEFFHTFNALHDNGKQIIITSDRPPKEIPKLEERLCSRFEWGLLADISKPDLETRIAILRKKAETDHLDIDENVLEMIAENISSNIRELEGCLTRLVLYSSLSALSDQPITVALAREALSDVFSKNSPHVLNCDDVMMAVAEYYGVTSDDLRSPKRQRAVAVPRQVAMYICRDMVNASLPVIGNAFNRDHTTVMHACDKVSEELKTSISLKNLISDIEHKLNNN